MNSELLTELGRQCQTLPERLGGHIFLTLVALAIGTIVSIPLGVAAISRPRLERWSLMLASIIQTVPGLALLALMVFVWRTIGWMPALIALTLYSVLPILRNTITGLKGIDPALLEAAAGVGMSSRQTLTLVQLPLATPVIVAGIRTAAVWVVGAATIAQPVGATSLGNYIFVGLQTLNFVSLIFGCILSAGLALTLDGLLHGVELAAAERSWTKAATMIAGIAFLAVSPLGLAALPSTQLAAVTNVAEQSDHTQTSPFIIGSKAFTEQYILADVIRRQLQSEGLAVDVRDGMGSATVFQALAAGQVDCFVDYTGTIWTNYIKRDEIRPPLETRLDVTIYLRQELDIYCVGPLGFSNDYVFATRRETAERLQIRTLFDLAQVSQQMNCGADIEFFGRPEWASAEQTYGLQFGQQTAMDSTLMYSAIANQQLDVIVAFNTDARLERYDLVVIEDPKFALPPYDAVLLISARMARNAAALKALMPLIQAIDTPAMRQANGMVDVDKLPVSAAGQYLFQRGR